MKAVLTQKTLENGVEVVLKENHFSPSVAIQCWVGVGSIDELADERGMAHFIEHMLFKGTKRRAVGEIAELVEDAGGEINAYTTFDHTVFHLTLGASHAALGVDLLADAITSSTFDPDEVGREREVILEEIKRGNDSPGAKVGRKIFEISFAGTEAARPIIGSEESVGGFTRDQIYGFYRRWYQPQNMRVIAVGDFDTGEMMALIETAFGAMAAKPVPSRQHPNWTEERARNQSVAKNAPMVSVLKGDYQQPRLEISFLVPPAEHADGPGLDLAAFALGSGELGRFNRRLRDVEGVVASVGASVYAPKFGGIFELSAITDEPSILAATTALARETARLRHHEPVTQDELARAKANLKSDRIFRDETVDGQARSVGYGMRTPYKLQYDDVYTALIDGIPETVLRGAVDRWLSPERAVIVSLLPESSTIEEAKLRRAFNEGWKTGVGERAVASTVKSARAASRRGERSGVLVTKLSPGVELVYRRNQSAQLFTLTAATEGGLRAENAENVGLHNALSSLLATASRRYGYEETMQLVEGRGAVYEGFSGKDSFGFHLQALTEQLDDMLPIFTAGMLEPVFPEEQWLSLKRELERAIASQDDSPAGICLRRFQHMIYGKHPYRFPLFGTADSVSNFDQNMLLQAFETSRDAGPWVIAASGSFSNEEIVAKLSKALTGFNPAAAPRKFPSEMLKNTGEIGAVKLEKDREQAHIALGFSGLDWSDPDRYALDVLVNVLGGHGGRLFKELRDKESLAYTVSPVVAYGRHGGAIGAYIACAPGKVSRALEGLRNEMSKVTRSSPTKSEVARAKNHIIGTHELGLQRSDAQTSSMALMQVYGYGFDDFINYPEEIAKVSEADILRAAQRLIKPDAAVEVVVGPSSTPSAV